MRSEMPTLAQIRIDGGTQPRTAISELVVSEYADAMRHGIVFPPLTVFFDGADYWLADGFHRYHALKASGVTVDIDCRHGTRRDAVLFSVGANDTHGLRRTNDDKRKAVQTLLADQEWAAWSDRKIADACSVSHPFVASIRCVTGNVSSEKREAERKVTTKHGTETTMKTAGIAASNHQRAQPAQAAPSPRSPVKTVKQAAAEQNADDAHGDTDTLAMLEELQRENESLSGQLQAAQADDLKAEAIKWRRISEQAERRQSELMGKVARLETEIQKASDRMRRIGKIFGEQDATKVPALVEAFYRQHAKVAA